MDYTNNDSLDIINSESKEKDIKNTNKKSKDENLSEISDKSWGITLTLCILLGLIGFHRFYVGKGGTALLMLLTFGGFGIWTVVDLIIIIVNKFTDEEGKVISRIKIINEQ